MDRPLTIEHGSTRFGRQLRENRLKAALVVAVVEGLLVLFDVRWRLLPLFVILIGVVWAFGVAGWLGIPLSITTIAGTSPPLQTKSPTEISLGFRVSLIRSSKPS